MSGVDSGTTNSPSSYPPWAAMGLVKYVFAGSGRSCGTQSGMARRFSCWHFGRPRSGEGEPDGNAVGLMEAEGDAVDRGVPLLQAASASARQIETTERRGKRIGSGYTPRRSRAPSTKPEAHGWPSSSKR